MTAIELQNHLKAHYPTENESCEWKEFKNLKHSISGGKGEDLATYVSAIANMNGGHIVIGVKDGTLNLLLLGKPEAVHLLSPAVPRITWVLKDRDGIEQGYEHFGLPLLVSAQKVHAKIRNYKYRYMADSKLFPDEIDKYDPWIIYEAMHNCIAHQDYEMGGRINVVEFPDKLVFSNVGSFIPENVENVIERDAPPELYRNPFLCQAMVEINMIDTIGSGIKRIYSKLRQRFFPMPNYKIEPTRVEVTIFGQILDERYAKLLATNPELSLHDVIALDRVVKHLPSTDESLKYLRDKGLIEGRKPNLYVSASVANATGDKAGYTKNRAFDKKYYFDFIEQAIQHHGSMNRQELDELLWKKLPDNLTDKQRKTKINNLINELSNKLKKICNKGSNTKPKWVLCGVLLL